MPDTTATATDPDALARDHIGFAVAVAVEHCARLGPSHLADEARSVAGWALLEAIRRRPPEGVPFKGHVAFIVKSNVGHMVRRETRWGRRRRRPKPLAVPIADWDAPRDGFADADRAEALDDLLRPLCPADRDLLRRVYGGGLTAAEAGAALGLNKKTSWRRHAAALRVLRSARGPAACHT